MEGYINIQYMYVAGKYKIYLYSFRNGQKREALSSDSDCFAASTNELFSDNVHVLFLSCNLFFIHFIHGKVVKFTQKSLKSWRLK